MAPRCEAGAERLCSRWPPPSRTSEPVTVLASSRQWEHARVHCHPRCPGRRDDDGRRVGPRHRSDLRDRLGEARAPRGGLGVQRLGWARRAASIFPWANDDLVAAKVCELEHVLRYRAPFVLEGGSIHVDGQGTCLTTEECLLNSNRNPDATKGRELERISASYLGVERVIWLPTRRRPETRPTVMSTTSRASYLARTGAAHVVRRSWRPSSEVSSEARRILESAVDARGRSLGSGFSVRHHRCRP